MTYSSLSFLSPSLFYLTWTLACSSIFQSFTSVFWSIVHINPSPIPVFQFLSWSKLPSAHPQTSQDFSLSWLYIPIRSWSPEYLKMPHFFAHWLASADLHSSQLFLFSSVYLVLLNFSSNLSFSVLYSLHSKATPLPWHGRLYHRYLISCWRYKLQTSETYCGKYQPF